MSDIDDDTFSHDDQILPETLGEWEEENIGKPDTAITPEEADEFFAQEDVGEQIDAMIKEVRGGIEFDTHGTQRAREYYARKKGGGM